MSLITRCPACGTMFKVVPDQLKVSQGWVRCGHCANLFDAALHLQGDEDVEPSVPAAVAAVAAFAGLRSARSVEPAPVASSRLLAQEQDFDWPASGPSSPDQVAAAVLQGIAADSITADFDRATWRRQSIAPLGKPGALLNDQLNPAVHAAQTEAQMQAPVSGPLVAHLAHETSDRPEPAYVVPEGVSFVRNAERQAFWRQPRVRLALCGLALLLVCVLLLQVVVQQRETIAALRPALKPLLQRLCQPLGCEVGPLRRIEAVVIDQSSFNKIDSDSYRLGFTIKNTGMAAVAMPSLEVTLTDAQDQPLLRRVLAPLQLGARSALLLPGADFAGNVLMQVADPAPAGAPSAAPSSSSYPTPMRIAGYRVLAFYP